jgi:hypothetical protein
MPGEECPLQVASKFHIAGRRHASGLSTYAGFINVRKAYDTIPHELLFYTLEAIGITGHMLFFLKAPAGGAAAAVPEGVRSHARRYPLTSQWWALETPQPCQAWHGRGLRGPTARSAGSTAVGKAMYIGLLKKIISVQYRRQDLPLGLSDMFFRSLILLDTILICGGGACTSGAFDGVEGTAGLAVGRGRWSWWWLAGKQRQERALAGRRPALCQSNLTGGEARHSTCRWPVAGGGAAR